MCMWCYDSNLPGMCVQAFMRKRYFLCVVAVANTRTPRSRWWRGSRGKSWSQLVRYGPCWNHVLWGVLLVLLGLTLLAILPFFDTLGTGWRWSVMLWERLSQDCGCMTKWKHDKRWRIQIGDRLWNSHVSCANSWASFINCKYGKCIFIMIPLR